MAKPVIAVDLDDVTADRLGVIAAYLRAEGRTVSRPHPTRWDLRDWGVRDKAEFDRLHYQAFVHDDGYSSMPPLAGAVEGLTHCHRLGYTIRIVTGRLWNAQVVRTALAGTGCWLEAHGVPVDDVAFVSDKTAIAADLYIEDAPHFISDLQNAGRRVLIMSTAYNQHLPGPRAASWSALVPQIALHCPLETTTLRKP